ncbi:DNA-processing protein DprA [Leifsonia poae]|uniref:DNA-processing protein DprA n=1 Tax=Leifsonia poae TaxID=110933 RepID=UPI003D684556
MLAPVRPSAEGHAAGAATSEERFARVALSTAIEPGDLDAGRLVDALGPVGLLRAIVDGPDAPHAASCPAEGEGRNIAADTAIGGKRARDALARWRQRLSLSESVKALERAGRIGARLLTPDSPWWPEGFASLDEGPPLSLWIRGDGARLQHLGRSIALVGARACTEYGEHVAMESAAGLSDRSFAIVSGGAYGIDAAAHRATLASRGMTVAFLAGGPDRLYPAGNSDLLKRVASEGVIAAELPPGSAPTRWRFLMRNRLIAAAATATVVVEAGHRSGSLNTAGHAAQMGRPLGAVPGSVLSPASAGCHRLIREYAATCVTTTDEMAELAEPFATAPPPDPAAPEVAATDTTANGDERAVLSALATRRFASADEIAARSALPFATVAAVLGRLDLAGRARESAGGWVLIDRSHR